MKKIKQISEIFLINSEKEILLQLRDDKWGINGRNRWNILGGGKENFETPRECIIREIYEELMINLEKPKLISLISDASEEFIYKHYIYYDFIKYRPEDLILKEGKKIYFFDINKIETLKIRKVEWFDRVYSEALKKIRIILKNNFN